jgi:NAD(P)-dependent dehydrogenase (short-subunit alcohol dehydrogenase family)
MQSCHRLGLWQPREPVFPPAPPSTYRGAMTTHQDTAGRVWLITGCSAGFGRAIADAALARGDRVVATARRPEALADLAGERALVVALDVTRQDEIHAAVDAALERFGRIDVLVNNAALYGTLKRRPFMEIPVEEWDRVMAVNLRGLFLCARAVFPAMKAQGKGKIVNIASSTFFKGVADYIHYTTSKGGVVGFTRSLARELGPHGIRVNAIAPGFTLSGDNEQNISEERKQANIDARMIRRAQVPEDLVGTLVYLASDDSDFMSGQTLLVDGGGSVH